MSRPATSRLRISLALAAAMVALTLPATPAEAACGTPRIRLGGFALQTDQQPQFFWGGEAQSGTVGAVASEFCPNIPPFEGKANWLFQFNGTASGIDTNPDFGQFTFQAESPHVPPSVPDFDPFAVAPDSTPEPAVETLTVQLQQIQNQGTVVEPSQAPVYLVDQDGAQRVATAPASPTFPETGGTFRFPIFRAGPASGTLNVTVEMTGGENGVHYQQPAPVSFGDGQRFKWAEIPIIDNNLSEGDQTFVATIANAGGAAIASPSSMDILVTDDDSDVTPPESSFHHPLHNKIYDRQNYLARTIHVFAPGLALEPSGIEWARTALRKTMKSGACKWWNGAGWTLGACTNVAAMTHWLPTWFFDKFNNKLIYEYPKSPKSLDPLKPSIGTKVKNYFVYGWSKDKAGNVETTFVLGRNKNRFEVKA